MNTAVSLVDALSRRHQTLATCESLTAGLAAATVASVPGASAVLRGGLITYATDVKESLAGVDAEILAEHGPVSAATAQAMAQGAQRACASTWAVALTGVAGPDSQDGHPVGEVFIGLAGPEGMLQVERVHLSGDRQAIRHAAVEAALEMLLRLIVG